MQAFVLVFLILCTESFQQLSSQSDLWISTFSLTDAQIKAANISQETARSLEVALRYERTNNAAMYLDVWYQDQWEHALERAAMRKRGEV